ncbi:unnamed protein product [Phytophthora lilii]|uniref:Unnamed protein product n=1 Tax=Phytophthora lilii TaxID=2077276 RepID=A0A9W6XRZ2_9STRA|nr:unnamed protein product [Phytophthora lilii]
MVALSAYCTSIASAGQSLSRGTNDSSSLRLLSEIYLAEQDPVETEDNVEERALSLASVKNIMAKNFARLKQLGENSARSIRSRENPSTLKGENA